MSRILVIESSARQQGSVSRELTQQFIANWQAAHPADQVQVRDLAAEPVPHLDATLLGGWMTPSEQQNDAEKAALARSNQLTDELLAADVLVLAAPMYNFAIPSTLKAWLDHVLRAGVTFKYTETGPQGLLTGKRAFVLTARGGIYAGSALDHQEPYLRQVLAFIGIHDVQFIHAEGLNMGAEFSEKGLAQAKANLEGLRGQALSVIAQNIDALLVGPTSDLPEAVRLDMAYAASSQIIDAASPFAMDDLCIAARGLCDLLDAAPRTGGFDWRISTVHAQAMKLLLALPCEAVEPRQRDERDQCGGEAAQHGG